MDMQEQFVANVTQAIIADPRIAGAWLEGSLGRDDADRFSDVDLHLLVTPAYIKRWREGMDAWLLLPFDEPYMERE